jgi:4-hydroxybenzoate polyprenyltransferase
VRTIAGLLGTMRPDQWTKNLVLFAGLLFSGGLGDRGLVLLAVWGFLVFCGLSGSAYILNDVADLKSDREHPEKRTRPIASGALRAGPATASAAAIAVAALFFAYRANVAFGHVALGYLCLNALYTTVLRRTVILDVMAIAIGFVLRAVASVEVLRGAAPTTELSPWLLVCTFFLALFLGRRSPTTPRRSSMR